MKKIKLIYENGDVEYVNYSGYCKPGNDLKNVEIVDTEYLLVEFQDHFLKMTFQFPIDYKKDFIDKINNYFIANPRSKIILCKIE
jgi:hypothetical protein